MNSNKATNQAKAMASNQSKNTAPIKSNTQAPMKPAAKPAPTSKPTTNHPKK